MLVIHQQSVRSVDAQTMIYQLSSRLQQITGSDGRTNFDLSDVETPRSVFVIGKENGRAVGCGAIREVSNDVAEIKRLYAAEPGKGIGKQILKFLEQSAKNYGYDHVVLETRRCNKGAVGFYLSNGYHVMKNYGPYRDNKEAICFVKYLGN